MPRVGLAPGCFLQPFGGRKQRRHLFKCAPLDTRNPPECARGLFVRMVIADYLRDCGYKVAEGGNAAEALAVLEAGKKIDVVLAEIRLAGSLDGFGLARQLRENHPEIDVILTSGVTRAAAKAAISVTMGRWKSLITRKRS
jgi:Response regulator receiver domain